MGSVSSFLRNKKVAYCLMGFLVFIWGFEYVAAKAALNNIDPLNLVFYKYLIAAIVLFAIRTVQGKRFTFKKKHIITLILCTISGEILYFFCEYSAMDYLPVSVISVILSFVPMLSIGIEAVVFKRRPNAMIVIGIIVCIIGVSMIIGVDFEEILAGKWIGYVLAFGAVVFWNIYNFVTERLTDEYEPFNLTFMQIFCTVALLLPYAIFNMPELSQFTGEVIGGVIYLGLGSASIGFLIYVLGITVLGPTPCSLFSNFLPITAAMFGWIFLNESLTIIQILGGAIVISAGVVVIWQKGKLDEEYHRLEESKL